ncbi:unnamed protein product [Danaus chrysippus]|uniref:(African queen) hypothetical protein n=1 Tax=Danaus chrysippus TaxID=151541 RepID=A0A8J2W076_9NEOP|nr:unnamed protein product [Danaus chrysippus]
MTEPPKKKVRCTFSQKRRLIELMEDNKEVALGIFTCPMGFQKMEYNLEEHCCGVGAAGPSKISRTMENENGVILNQKRNSKMLMLTVPEIDLETVRMFPL